MRPDFKNLKMCVGYNQPEFTETCGTCSNCAERGNHLRCMKHGFGVAAFGICRNGYKKGPRQIEMNFQSNNKKGNDHE